MSKSNLKFIVSPDNDIKGFFVLNKSSNNSERILSLIKKNYPKIEGNPSEKIVKDFVYKQYLLRNNAIIKNSKKIAIAWGKNEKKFNMLVKEIFPSSSFLKGIVVFPSIWPSYIRDIKTKSLSYPFNKGIKHAIFVICHELLHFYLFSYLERFYKKDLKKIKNNRLWDFSEVLNVLIQQDKSWVRITGLKPAYYPQHKSLYIKMKKDWGNHDIDCLIRKYLLN